MGFFERFFGRKKERRQWPRYRLYEAMYLDYECPERGFSGHAEGLDLSEHSIRFAALDKFSVGDSLELLLEYQANKAALCKIKVRARVVRCQRKSRQGRYRTACVFESINEENLRELKAFLDWLKDINTRHLHNRYGPADH